MVGVSLCTAAAKIILTHRNPRRLPVLVESRLTDDVLDMVTIMQGSGEGLHDDGSNTFATSVTISACVPHARPTVLGQHVQVTLGNEHGWHEDEVGTGGDGDRGLAAS